MSTTTSSTTALPCSVCGELVSPGDLFCGSCGAAVGAGDSPGGRPRDLSDHNRNRNHRRTGQRVVAVIAGFVTVAAVSGLVVAFVDARRDLDKERKELTVANTRVAELTTQLDETADPDVSLQTNLSMAQQELVDMTAQLAQSQADLTAERDGRAADAVVNQNESAAAVAVVQAQLDAVQAQLDADQAQLTALEALYPLDEDTFRAASPTGEYAVTIKPVECTIVNCFELKSLSLSFPDATKVSGSRANGIISFADGSYSVSGDLPTEQAPFCNGADTDSTFALEFHASKVLFDNGLLAATELVGTYRETIAAGDCAGQFRAYTLTMTKTP